MHGILQSVCQLRQIIACARWLPPGNCLLFAVRYGRTGSQPSAARACLAAARSAMPDGLPLLVRISATDWVDGGWDIEQTVARYREAGRKP